MSFYSLPYGKLHKKDDVKKLNNLTSNYSHLSYKERANDVDVDLPSTVAKKILAESQPLTDDIKNFFLGTSNYARGIQLDIDLYMTRGRHKQASFRRKLDPIEKSVWRTENPLVLLFKDIANFDGQNPVIGSLLREIDLGKNRAKSSLISTACDINDTVLLHRFKKLKETPVNYNYNDDDDNNDNNINNSKNNNYNNISLGPPPSPIKLSYIFETAPPSFNFSNVNLQQQLQQQQQRQQPLDRFSTAAVPGTQVMSEIEKVIEKEKTKEQEKEITPSDLLLEYFKNADNFILEKERNEAELKNFKKQDRYVNR